MHRTLKMNFISLSKSFEILSKYFSTKNFNLSGIEIFFQEKKRERGKHAILLIFIRFETRVKKIDTIFPNDISHDRPNFNPSFIKNQNVGEQKRKGQKSGNGREEKVVVVKIHRRNTRQPTSLPSKEGFNRWDLIRLLLFNLHAGARCNELSSRWKRLVVVRSPTFPYRERKIGRHAQRRNKFDRASDELNGGGVDKTAWLDEDAKSWKTKAVMSR